MIDTRSLAVWAADTGSKLSMKPTAVRMHNTTRMHNKMQPGMNMKVGIAFMVKGCRERKLRGVTEDISG
jgi:hypothetical protein